MYDWFKAELKAIMPNGELRLVRDPRRLGLDLWVIERKIPASEHQAGLEQLRLAGEERYIPLDLPGVGLIQYDCAPEWHMVHICKSDTCDHIPPQFCTHLPECYREPNAADLMSIRRWLFEFRNFEHQQAVMRQEEKTKNEQLDEEFNFGLRKDLKSSHVLRGLEFGDAPKKVMEGTILIP